MKHFQVIDNRTFFYVDDNDKIYRARLTNRWNKEEVVFEEKKKKKDKKEEKPKRDK